MSAPATASTSRRGPNKSGGLAFIQWRRAPQTTGADAPALRLKSPFSLPAALKLGLVLLLIQLASVVAQQVVGLLAQPSVWQLLKVMAPVS